MQARCQSLLIRFLYFLLLPQHFCNKKTMLLCQTTGRLPDKQHVGTLHLNVFKKYNASAALSGLVQVRDRNVSTTKPHPTQILLWSSVLWKQMNTTNLSTRLNANLSSTPNPALVQYTYCKLWRGCRATGRFLTPKYISKCPQVNWSDMICN